MGDITDALAAYSNVCELSSGVRDLLRAARADIIDLRQRFAVVEEKYFDALKHWNETCAERDAANARAEKAEEELTEWQIQETKRTADVVKERDAAKETAGAWLNATADAKLENERLRAALANSELPCIYCSLPKDEWSRCQNGFPGCDRADDAMGCPELGAAIERDALRAELAAERERAVAAESRYQLRGERLENTRELLREARPYLALCADQKLVASIDAELKGGGE